MRSAIFFFPMLAFTADCAVARTGRDKSGAGGVAPVFEESQRQISAEVPLSVSSGKIEQQKTADVLRALCQPN